MSTQANKKAIGLFVIAAIALVVGIIVIFGSGKFFETRNKFVAYFEGSVKGLRVGAPVVFRGVEIGEVTRINIYVIHEDQSFLIPVIFEINSDSFHAIGPNMKDRKKSLTGLIEKGLRAQLQMQSLVTGQLMINIDFYPNEPLSLVGDKGLTLPEDLMEIPTIQTPLQRIGKTLEEIPLSEIMKSTTNSLKKIEEILTSQGLRQSIDYFEKTMKGTRDIVSQINEKIDPLSDDVGQTLSNAKTLLQTLNRRLNPLLASLKRTSDSADSTLRDTQKLVNNFNGQIDTLSLDFTKILDETRQTLSSVNGTMEAGSPLRFQIDTTMRELAQAARSIKHLANYLERNPDALIRGRVQMGGE